MLTDYAATGSQELWNMVRLQAYLENVGSPFTTGSDICGCDTINRTMLEDEALPGAVYDTPATDPAPWYDADLPVSGEFLGFMPLSVDGLDDNPRARNITNTVGGGGIFGPVRDQPRTITVTGLLIGSSCCGAEYGIHYLSEALLGCTGDACDGDCFSMYNCCPSATSTKAAFDAEHKRTFRRVALVSGPTVTARTGGGTCVTGTCGGTGDIIQIEFVLVAASPWAWTETTELLDVGLPIGGTGPCIEWCLSGSGPGTGASPCATGDCVHADCASAADACADPLKTALAPPEPTAPEAAFCVPLASERACYTVDLTSRPQWSSDVPMVTINAGASELRNVRITFYERPTGTTLTCEQIAEANRCNPLMDFFITYLPANGSITLDGQISRATTECLGQCQSASNVFGGVEGGPVQFSEMNCASFCVCLETDPNFPPDATATFSLAVSGKVY